MTPLSGSEIAQELVIFILILEFSQGQFLINIISGS